MPKCKNKKQNKTKTRKQWSLLCVGLLSLTWGFLWSIVNMSNNNPLKKVMFSLLAVLVGVGLHVHFLLSVHPTSVLLYLEDPVRSIH